MTTTTRIDTAPIVAAISQARRDINAAATFQDPLLSDAGLFERRRGTVTAARTFLTSLMPPEPEPVERTAVLESLRPVTADDLALQTSAWGKVRARLDAGRRLEVIIANADRLTLAAIADNLETMPEVLGSADADYITAEFNAAIWGRLVQVDPEAAKIAETEAEQALPLAIREVLASTAETGRPSHDSLAALIAADESTYRALIDQTQDIDTDPRTPHVVGRMLESLDQE